MATDTLSPETSVTTDLVSQLAGLRTDSPVAALRAARADATRYTQGSHDALFSADVSDLSLTERLYAAWYAAWLTPSAAASVYRERLLAGTDDAAANAALLDAIAAHGPATPASIDLVRDARLTAILAHTHALITRPASSGPAELKALQSAGLTTRAIIALAQLVAFVSYQVRVVAALKALSATEKTA